MKTSSSISCLACDRRPAIQRYSGVVPMAVLCDRCQREYNARGYNLTPVVHAEPRQIQTATAR